MRRSATPAFVLALALALCAAAIAAAGPRAVVDEPIYDAGRVPPGEPLGHDFVLRNEGDEALELHRVEPACGCTVAAFDALIPPGGEGRVRTTLDTTTFRGPIAKGLTVYTNDIATPTLRLTIKADVEPVIEVVPGWVRFEHVQGETPPTAVQTVWATNGRNLKLTAEEAPLPHLSVEVRPATAAERRPEGPAEQWAVAVTLAGDAPVGPLNVPLALATNHPQRPLLQIPVTGLVRPRLMAVPPAADFGRFSGGDPRRASVLVTVHGAPIRITGVSSDLPGLTARLSEEEEGRRYAIDLTLRPGASGPISGTLRATTDDPEQPLLEIPVRGTVLR